MTGPEKGFLLLTSHLGNPERRVLSTAQMRILTQRIRQQQMPQSDRELEAGDIVSLGYGREMAERILELLAEEELLRHYCHKGERAGCRPLTWVTGEYPGMLRRRLGEESPGVLWAKGDLSLLTKPKISLVGSRDLEPRNRNFAREVGRQAARQGFVLVSGNARGADQTAQNACLNAGGSVISVVADSLESHKTRQGVLYLSESSFDEDFSAQRAISRNRVIHALGEKTFVAQCTLEQGGTWDGTVKNLRFGWSPVYCFRDGSPAAQRLCRMGAEEILPEQLADFSGLPRRDTGFFEE